MQRRAIIHCDWTFRINIWLPFEFIIINQIVYRPEKRKSIENYRDQPFTVFALGVSSFFFFLLVVRRVVIRSDAVCRLPFAVCIQKSRRNDKFCVQIHRKSIKCNWVPQRTRCKRMAHSWDHPRYSHKIENVRKHEFRNYEATENHFHCSSASASVRPSYQCSRIFSHLPAV